MNGDLFLRKSVSRRAGQSTCETKKAQMGKGKTQSSSKEQVGVTNDPASFFNDAPWVTRIEREMIAQRSFKETWVYTSFINHLREK